MTYLALYQKEYTSSGEVRPHSKLLSKFSFLLLPEPVDVTISITLQIEFHICSDPDPKKTLAWRWEAFFYDFMNYKHNSAILRKVIEPKNSSIVLPTGTDKIVKMYPAWNKCYHTRLIYKLPLTHLIISLNKWCSHIRFRSPEVKWTPSIHTTFQKESSLLQV